MFGCTIAEKKKEEEKEEEKEEKEEEEEEEDEEDEEDDDQDQEDQDQYQEEGDEDEDEGVVSPAREPEPEPASLGTRALVSLSGLTSPEPGRRPVRDLAESAQTGDWRSESAQTGWLRLLAADASSSDDDLTHVSRADHLETDKTRVRFIPREDGVEARERRAGR